MSFVPPGLTYYNGPVPQWNEWNSWQAIPQPFPATHVYREAQVSPEPRRKPAVNKDSKAKPHVARGTSPVPGDLQTKSDGYAKALKKGEFSEVRQGAVTANPRMMEKVVEVPVDGIVEKIVRVEVPIEKVVEKRVVEKVEVPVERIVEKIVRVEVPIEKVKEKILSVPAEKTRQIERSIPTSDNAQLVQTLTAENEELKRALMEAEARSKTNQQELATLRRRVADLDAQVSELRSAASAPALVAPRAPSVAGAPPGGVKRWTPAGTRWVPAPAGSGDVRDDASVASSAFWQDHHDEADGGVGCSAVPLKQAPRRNKWSGRRQPLSVTSK